MSKTRRAKQGEHLSGIAAQEGFANFHTVFDHANNAALKNDLKRDPHVLFPGDEVFIPDRQDRTESGATDASHRFQVEIRPLFLICKLLDWQREPIQSAPCKVQIDGETVPPLATDGAGLLVQRIGRLARAAQIEAELPPPKVVGPDEARLPRPTTFHVKIGSLNPQTKLSGQQARLNNLGYEAGFDVRELDQLLWAAEEFLCDDSGHRVRQRPAIVPAPPQGEDDPDRNDPASPTGLQDAALLARLAKVHGF
ncbi:MAG: hypothetical protein KGL43_11975 [Burkholderiales bacterium]|nr:hypothetical protein [Burkholderiales bacterium]MDE2394211.1 hypothetical protein [Burkholderiales bacterium]MDE2454300.1 hypothetical protein [Burkholderiales bacterium]